MICTPAILPPQPSTIPSLSPLAQSVLALIRQEGEGGGTCGSEPSYRAVPHPPCLKRNCVNANVQQKISETAQDLLGFQRSTAMNSIPYIARHQSREERSFVSEFDLNSYSTSQILPGYENRPINISRAHNDVQQREEYLRSFYSQTQPSESLREPITKENKTQYYLSPFGPSVEIRENVGINQPDDLSPEMEFDDVEIYSCPLNEQEKENVKVFDSGESSAPKFAVTTLNRLNFKEIKPRPLQKRGLQINTPLPSSKPSNDGNRISIPNKMQPSDQTFILNSLNTAPKFKKTLEKFKNTPCKQSGKSSCIQITKDDKAPVQGDLQSKIHNRKRTFNEASFEKSYQKSLHGLRPKEDNFELDSVFDDTFEDVFAKMEEGVNDGKSMKESIKQKIETNVKKVASNVALSDSAHLPKKCEGLLGENTYPRVVDKEQEKSNILAFSTDSNLNHKSELTENIFVKTQESQSVNNFDYVQNRDGQNQAELLTIPPLPENVKNNTSDALCSQGDLSENLFVKTQESVIAQISNRTENRVGNEIYESNLSEELSFPPFQKPFESEDSPDFDVDDLFSLPSTAVEGKFENTETLKCNGNEEGKILPSYKGTMFNVTSNNFMKSNVKIKLNENSFCTDNNQMTQVTDETLSINKNIEGKNFQSVMPVKSIYFQASNKKENLTKEPESISLNNGVDRENSYSIKSSKYPNQTKGKTTGGINCTVNNGSKDRKKCVELDIGLGRGKHFSDVTNSFSKKAALKQSTLFDCRKFQTGIKNKEDLLNMEPKQIPQPVEVESENFKKPLPPMKKAKIQRPSSKTTNVKNSGNSKSANSLENKPSKSNGLNEFLQSNTPLQEIKKRCNPSKLVQKSLLKNESVSSVTTQKKSKKPSFVPPIAASHLTSQQVPLKNYTITVVDEVGANEILRQLESEELTKVVTTVTFKEGYTLLNKPEDQKKNSRCFPSGLMFLLTWGSGKSGYHWLPLVDPATITPSVIKLVDTLMSKSERNICFEAQAVYELLMDVLKYKDVSQWNAYDPLIGCWLLDPDNPPKDFQEASEKLQMDRNLLVVNPQANTKDQACDLLPVLDVAMNILQSRLVSAALWTVFTDMETKVIPILATMESASIAVDVERLHRTADAMDRKLRQIQSRAHELADRWFQLNSPQQLREILFDKLKLDEKFGLKIKKTEHGEKSTSESVLEQMKDLHPLPKIILEYRRLHKLKSTYVDGLIGHVRSDGTVGTSWEQVSAATGRITSKNPNLQAFPKCPISVQEGETINLREMFRAREGCSFLAADFQQIEFRVFAHFTQDKLLLQAFREGGDIFQRLAERWLGGKGEEEREKTKRIVYSVMYGAGANKLSEYLRVEPSEAYKIIDNFVAIFPSLRSLPRSVIAQCRVQGSVATLSGRRRLFPHIRSTHGALRSHSERQAMNFLIQGSAADICKAAMLDCEAEIRRRGLKARLLLMIHDELIWEVDDTDLAPTAKTVREAMEHRWNERLTLLVPIPVCVSTGKTLANMQTLVEADKHA